MRTTTVMLAAAAAAMATGCAPTPESIQPSYVSEMPFRSWTCDQLGEELGRLDSALATAYAQQNTARTNDTVGVLLIGLPVGSMSGQSVAPQIASYKGQQEAVRKASIRNNCPELTRIQPVRPPAQPGTPPASEAPVSTSEMRQVGRK